MNATTYENYINPMAGKPFMLPDDVVFADLKCRIDDANHLSVDWERSRRCLPIQRHRS